MRRPHLIRPRPILCSTPSSREFDSPRGIPTAPSLGFSPVLALRRSCLDGGGAPEVACNADASSNRAHIDTTLDAGTYFAVVDGQGRASQGAYALEYVFSPAGGKTR